ncbi:hypothetical protein [Luteolibacter luteus]|uniref:Uncharacterized protein n=1 Tax=Luteolibacter luteus TaxID=2728835 RepID=A0A858RQS4_9BACT|nr:hypothetical protein [Luteolibacter luteus]QJE98884.1 hypothetical protein HHL09_24920 [Luteolibacter luteus]
MSTIKSKTTPATPRNEKLSERQKKAEEKWTKGIPETTRLYLGMEPDPYRRFLVVMASAFAAGYAWIYKGNWTAQVIYAAMFLIFLGVSVWFKHWDEKED